MKYCPSCQTNYTDDTLQYCLQDGTPLAEFIDQSSPAVFPTETVTQVSPRRVEPLEEIQPAPNWRQNDVPGVSPFDPPPRKSNTALTVLLTALGMFALFALAGIGAWLYFKNGKTEIVQNKNTRVSNANRQAVNAKENSNVTPSPTVANKTPSPDPTTQPTADSTPAPPDYDPEEIKDEVSGKIDSWKSLTESRNLNALMSNYADTVDYYNKPGASASFVRNDKQRAFDGYDYIKMDLSNMRVSPDTSGENATAVFDKEWVFEGDGKYSAGKVQTQLRLRKIAGEWRITGERDLKVYYTEK